MLCYAQIKTGCQIPNEFYEFLKSEQITHPFYCNKVHWLSYCNRLQQMIMSLLWIGYYKIVKLWHYDIHYFVRQWLTITDECVPEIKSFKSGIQLNKWEFLVTCCKLFIFSLQLNSNIFSVLDLLQFLKQFCCSVLLESFIFYAFGGQSS